MRKPIRLVYLAAAAAILAGCAAPAVSSEILTEDYDGAVPVMVQLLVGTFQLDGTELSVSAEQAVELLPLWKAMRSLSESDATAQAEMEAVLDQIAATLTEEQLGAIAEMQLTQEDLFGAIQDLGVLPQGGERVSGEGGPLPGEVFIGPGEGGSPGGGQPGGGFITGGPGGFSQDLGPDQIATLEARRESGEGPVGRMALFLIDPLIEMLKELAAGSEG